MRVGEDALPPDDDFRRLIEKRDLAAVLLAYFSSLSAGQTHYGTMSGPIYFGADYVTQQKWRQLGLIASVLNILM